VLLLGEGMSIYYATNYQVRCYMKTARGSLLWSENDSREWRRRWARGDEPKRYHTTEISCSGERGRSERTLAWPLCQDSARLQSVDNQRRRLSRRTRWWQLSHATSRSILATAFMSLLDFA